MIDNIIDNVKKQNEPSHKKNINSTFDFRASPPTSKSPKLSTKVAEIYGVREK